VKSEEEPISAGQPDGTAAPRGHGSARAASGHQQAAIVIAVRDGSEQEDLSRELSGRYGVDYQIVVCAEPADLESQIEKLLLQVTRKNDPRGYERFKDLFEAIVAYNE